MGDTNPLATSEHFVLMDVSESRTDLNLPQDGGQDGYFREGKPSIFSNYNVNGRIVVVAIALLCFILALILFIGTVVVFHSRPVHPLEACALSSSGPNGFGINQGTAFQDNVNVSDKNGKSQGIGEAGHAYVKASQDPIPAFNSLDRSVTTVNGIHVKPGVLIYDEEFKDFNTTVWNHFIGNSDNHFYYYVNERTNSFVRDGKLFIKPTYTADQLGENYLYNGTMILGILPSSKCINQTSLLCWKKESQSIIHPIMSAMVNSKESFKFQYGRLVIRAKMPSGDWIEPIISLQPAESVYGEGLLSGQVHLTDTRGNRKLQNSEQAQVGSERNCPDIRFGNDKDTKILFYCLNTKDDEGFDREFHDYEVLWTPDSITIKIDGEGVVMAPNPRPSIYKLWSKGRHIKNPWHAANNKVMAPFDSEFYLAIGLSVGGSTGFFHDDFEGPYPKPWKNGDPHAPKTFWENRANWSPSWEGDGSALQIESIKLWSLNITTSD